MRASRRYRSPIHGQLQSKFRPISPQYAAHRVDVGSPSPAKGIWLDLHIGNGVWNCFEIRAVVSGPSGHTTSQLRREAFLQPGAVLETDGTSAASVTFSGTWTNGTSGSANNGNFRYSTSTAAYVDVVLPVGTTEVSMKPPLLSNGGYGKFPDWATLLPTAQEEVNAGKLDSTALIAGGGTLNPTDRVFSFYMATPGSYVTTVPIANNLTTDTPRTLRMIPTGYKEAASSAARAYVDTFSYSYVATAAEFAAGEKPEIARLFWGSSVWEYAIYTDKHADFIGNSHGWDQDVSANLIVDGAVVDLANGQGISGNDIRFERVSQLIASDLSVIADVAVIYYLTPGGLRVTTQIDWRVSGSTPQAAYIAMHPRDITFQRCRNSGLPAAQTLTVWDSSFYSDAAGASMATWEGAGRSASLMQILNVEKTARNYPSAVQKLGFQARSAVDFNKVYARRADNTTVEYFDATTSWSSEVIYVSRRFDDPEVELSL